MVISKTPLLENFKKLHDEYGCFNAAPVGLCEHDEQLHGLLAHSIGVRVRVGSALGTFENYTRGSYPVDHDSKLLLLLDWLRSFRSNNCSKGIGSGRDRLIELDKPRFAVIIHNDNAFDRAQ